MKKIIYNTIIGGVFFLIPLFVLLKIFGVLINFFKNLGPNIAKFFGFEGVDKYVGSSLAAVLAILFICFLFGMLAKWSMASRIRNWFDEKLTNVFPLYSYYRAIIEQGLSLKNKESRPVVLVEVGSVWRPGIVTAHLADGKACVFMPMVPKITDGELLIVDSNRLVPILIEEKKLNELLLLMGAGFENTTFAKSI